MFNEEDRVGRVFVFLEVFANEGGIQAYNQNLLEAYLRLEEQPPAEVFILRDPPDCSNPFASRSLKFRYFGDRSPRLGRLQLAAQLFLCLLQKRPQHVFCGHINLAQMVQLFCQILKIPYTVITHGKEVWEPLPPSQQRALQDASSLWTVSRYSRDRASKTNNINPRKFQLLPCTVDSDRFTPAPKPPYLLDKYGLRGAKVLMTVARLWPGDIYKGVDVTLRALPEIAQAFPEVKYLVIGRGGDRPRLEQLARDLGVADRVIFAGFIPTAELPDHYRIADAYIMPSQEGFGIVYLEAMACGVPVLAGNSDGSADPLQDGKLGWRVPHRDPQAVTSACLEILRGEDRRCDGEWLREKCLDGFAKPAFSRQLQQLLESASWRDR